MLGPEIVADGDSAEMIDGETLLRDPVEAFVAAAVLTGVAGEEGSTWG